MSTNNPNDVQESSRDAQSRAMAESQVLSERQQKRRAKQQAKQRNIRSISSTTSDLIAVSNGVTALSIDEAADVQSLSAATHSAGAAEAIQNAANTAPGRPTSAHVAITVDSRATNAFSLVPNPPSRVRFDRDVTTSNNRPRHQTRMPESIQNEPGCSADASNQSSAHPRQNAKKKEPGKGGTNKEWRANEASRVPAEQPATSREQRPTPILNQPVPESPIQAPPGIVVQGQNPEDPSRDKPHNMQDEIDKSPSRSSSFSTAGLLSFNGSGPNDTNNDGSCLQQGVTRPAKSKRKKSAFIWPRGGRKPGFFGRLKDVLTGKGPDIYLAVNRQGKTVSARDGPSFGRWSGWKHDNPHRRGEHNHQRDVPKFCHRDVRHHYDYATRRYLYPENLPDDDKKASRSRFK